MNRSGLLILLLLIPLSLMAWDWWPLPMAQPDTCRDTISYMVKIDALTSSGQYAPFWLQNHREGAMAASAHSGNLTAGIVKPATHPNRWWDYDFAVSLTGQLHSTIPNCPDATYQRIGNGYTNRLYAHVRLYIVDLTAGVFEQQYNSADPSLTSGSLLFSGNAHPMPGLHIGIDKWTAIPGLYGYAEIKGGISHFWQNDNTFVQQGMIHHKYMGARVGGKLPVHISYEFHHAAQWGGYSPIYGDLGNNWQAIKNAFLARQGGSNLSDQINAQGNHLGEQRLTMDLQFKGWEISLYWHQMFEDGPIRFMTNMMTIRDGLWGINIQQNNWPYIQSLTYELIRTDDQSGPFHDKDGFIYGGFDNYYNNSIYSNGWNYHYRTLGNPFITSPVYNQNQQIGTTNNRVRAHYIGIRGDIKGFQYRAICSFQQNYGTYLSNPQSILISSNAAWMVELSKTILPQWGLSTSIALGGDAGNQFGNTFGALLTIRKQGIILIH